MEYAYVSIDAGRLEVNSTAPDGAGTVRDLGNVVLLPGLVNAHTHLEFSGLAQPLGDAGMPFPSWIQRVIGYRRERDADPAEADRRRLEAVERGLSESHASGTACVGEIATPGWPAAAFSPAAGQGVVFLELLGNSFEWTHALLEKAGEHLQTPLKDGWRHGLSPHAPYTVRVELVQKVCRLSAERRVPVAMHLAETLCELELMRSACGDLVEFLRSLGVWDPGAVPRGIRPFDYLQMLRQAHRALVIHGNYLSEDEVQFLSEQAATMSLVYCPRTHDHFGHGEYPLRELLEAGVHVAIGTDSRASNPDLSLWNELRFVAARYPDIAPDTLLRLGTLNGARALGYDAAGSGERGLTWGTLIELDQEFTGDLAADLLLGNARVICPIGPGHSVDRWNAGA